MDIRSESLCGEDEFMVETIRVRGVIYLHKAERTKESECLHCKCQKKAEFSRLRRGPREVHDFAPNIASEVDGGLIGGIRPFEFKAQLVEEASRVLGSGYKPELRARPP